MKDFKQEVVALLAPHIEEMSKEEIFETIEFPKNPEMGDFAFPCFKLAKVFRKAPNMIAADLVEKIGQNPDFEAIESVAAYVNFKVDRSAFSKSVIETVLDQKDQYGGSNEGEGKNIIVEFSSTNIAKPFHMGHIRSTMIGNSLYRIHKFLGYNTTSINHLGDYGTQFGKLIVAYKLWGDKETIEANPIPELLKIYVKFHDTAEEQPELEDQAREWFTKLEKGDKEAYDLWNWFKEVSLKEYNRVFDMLDVHFDSYAGESFYSDKMPAVLEELREKNVVEKSQGAEIVDLEEYGMPPALITKSDGSTLYMTRDLAAAKYRKEHYKFDKNIYVVGAAQQLHFKQWFKVIELMGYEWAKDCVHVEFGMVALEEGSLSTRKGRVVFLEDVLKQATAKTLEVINEKNPKLENKEQVAQDVGVGAVVFQELLHNRIKDYTFSLDRTLSFEGETGPYVQYTHTRCCSVLRKVDFDWSQNIDFTLLSEEVSKDVVRLLSKFPLVVKDAAKKYEPSLITRYIVDLAQTFNHFYHETQILVDDKEVAKARTALVAATAQVLKNGLYLISVKAPEKM